MLELGGLRMMTGPNKYRAGILASAFAIAAIGSGCDKVKECAEDIKDSYTPTCDADALANGNASVTGVAGVDGFFSAVLGFERATASVAGGIDAELEGIRGDFGLESTGEVGALLTAKLDTYIEGDLAVRAQPARCEVDAQASFEASASCQASLDCEVMVDPGKAEFECKGGCELDVNVEAELECDANASLICEVEAPSVPCEGSCQGSCTIEIEASADIECTGSCGGTCTGTCDGECVGDTDDGAGCEGVCTGTCTGSCDADCKVDMEVAATCEGTCSGSCTADSGSVDCDAAVSAKCEGSASADASVTCSGKCDGDFEPPSAMVECDAAASCNAQAKAEASFNVECTPPTLEIDYQLKAGLSVEAEAEFKAGISKLRGRLPKLLVALKKGNLVVAAGGDLVVAAEGAVDGVIAQAGKGDVEAIVGLVCAPPQFAAAGGILKDARTDLQGSLSAAVKLRDALKL